MSSVCWPLFFGITLDRHIASGPTMIGFASDESEARGMSVFERIPGLGDETVARLTFAALFVAAGLFAAVVWLTH
jgi:hypothetical protein